MRNTEYYKQPNHRYNCQKGKAKARGISWEISFEDWWNIWEASGHWNERGQVGYQMCRYGDEGPYHKDNVYIATRTQNSLDAWKNGKTKLPRRKDKISIEQRKDIFYKAQDIRKSYITNLKILAKEYDISYVYMLNIIGGRHKI